MLTATRNMTLIHFLLLFCLPLFSALTSDALNTLQPGLRVVVWIIAVGLLLAHAQPPLGGPRVITAKCLTLLSSDCNLGKLTLLVESRAY